MTHSVLYLSSIVPVNESNGMIWWKPSSTSTHVKLDTLTLRVLQRAIKQRYYFVGHLHFAATNAK